MTTSSKIFFLAVVPILLLVSSAAFADNSESILSGEDTSAVSPKQDTLIIIQGNIINSKTKKNISIEGVINIQYEDIDMVPMEVPTYDDGTYAMEIPYGHKYKIWPGIENFLTVDEAYVDVMKIKDGNYVVNKDLYVDPIEIGTKVRLDNIFFETGRSELSDQSTPQLQKVSSFLNKYPNMVIEIAGHTDDVGSAESNKALSQSRANAVMNYLVKQGVSKARVKAVGYGESKPVASNETSQGKQQNRRVEFEILKK